MTKQSNHNLYFQLTMFVVYKNDYSSLIELSLHISKHFDMVYSFLMTSTRYVYQVLLNFDLT